MIHSLWKVMPVFALSLGALALDAKMFQSEEKSNMDMEECEEKCCFACRERPCRQIACFCIRDEVDPCRPCWYKPLRECVSCWGESIKVDFLYWGAQNNGFAYAQTVSTGIPATTRSYSVNRISQHWSPGVRVALMHEFVYDFWDVSASWTWYKNTMSESQSIGTLTKGYASIFPPTPVVNLYADATGKWRVLHNLIDLDLGKEYRLSKAFAVRPHWGLRAAWIHQSFGSNLTGALAGATYTSINLNAKQNWFGFGPRLGVCSDWEVGYGFSVVGKASASALYGKMKTDSTYALAGATPAVYNVTDHNQQFTPSFQTFFGLQWGLCFNDGKAACAIQAGWENNYWFNQFHLPTVSSVNTSVSAPTANQPLELEGLTLNVRFDF